MKECLFVDGLFGDVIPSMKKCLFVDGLFGDVIPSMKECLFVDGLLLREVSRGLMGYFPLEVCF